MDPVFLESCNDFISSHLMLLQDDDEADTVGCCSLKVEHVALVAPSSIQVRRGGRRGGG